MFELLRSLSHWIEGFADSPWAVAILVINSFTESIFNPVPPDPLLVGMAVLNPHLALFYAALVTAASVLGAVVGHWLGLRLGRPVILRFIPEEKVWRVERMFQRYGTWAVLIAAFTPIPYKVFAITAGVLKMRRRPFILASIVGRGVRFFLLGALLFFFGGSIQRFIEARFELLTILFTILLVAGVIAGFFIMKRRRANGVAELRPESHLETD